MSIQPDMEKWKRRFFACLVLATGTLFLTGAREVTQDLRQPARQRQAEAEMRAWGQTVLADTPGALRPRTVLLDPAAARVMLEACSRPVREGSNRTQPKR